MKPRYIKDISGIKKGRLTAIRFVERVGSKSLWLFNCDCGKRKVLIGSDVMRDKVKSCGCMITEHARKQGRIVTLPDNNAYKNRIYRSYASSARKRKYSFNLTKSQFISLISMRCYYCNEEPSNSIREGQKELFLYSGIDRKDNAVGYSEDNCVPCCAVCNKMKMNLSITEFLKQIKKIMTNKFEGR